ncbi:MAG: excinuclease ABC subunit UvrA [Desulfobacula sp.]|jgi:excinuclease ABC subunit A|uniref:excinuclease ABC subunit UvrA n=1 Tax=Desulfobacula sp. TaxID=2593537 RepID=UPI001DBA8022|nr:excinuclease ABC subunit UvrA [Desulfobacula sp.]MBT3487831.1 excinuclease ABC subunit UvrA [Desulfobacula sp.]MBT3806496.1 excinuclease ABC subunit UvrA [Desulfobacula sp.]MBT4027347.1 excinuclease ABC subunit UvrA [Desulfobacula sp.]MBT4200822.1 excinuclease ABC subunit UvrA [Desulfobacula sp.]
MDKNKIIIEGAREHNLKNISVEIPRNSLTIITGLSGSGKSTLAFDTLYAEGQRRYVESLSTYARQFLGQMDKPDVDAIIGLSPAISIEQKTASHNPRSTVGTVTEIYDYLRLLFARVGIPYCYKCGLPISSMSIDQITDQVMDLDKKSKIMILAPLITGQKGSHEKLFAKLKKDGFARIRVDNKIYLMDDVAPLEKNKKHTIDAVVDRLVIKNGIEKRLTDSLELALSLSGGLVTLLDITLNREILFSEKASCLPCKVSYPEFTPASFSFNSPQGACKKCGGLGSITQFDPDLIVPDPMLSLRQGAILPWENRDSVQFMEFLDALVTHYKEDIYTPFKDLSNEFQQVLLYGSKKEEISFYIERMEKKIRYKKTFEGVIPNLKRRYHETDSNYIREEIKKFMNFKPCSVCNGSRINRASASVRVGDKTIWEITSLSIQNSVKYISSLCLLGKDKIIAEKIIKELVERLSFLQNVGLEYLTLGRSAATLSGGESQRIRLATQIGSKLTGVLYVLDEPSIGLHQKDNARLLTTLMNLRDLGNTVLVVEHDEETILSSDHVIDIGPGAGINGGEVIFSGIPEELVKNKISLTGLYLSGKKNIQIPEKRRTGNGKSLTIYQANSNNLKYIDVSFPLGCFTCVTGVSGSGKSTLVLSTLYPILANRINRSRKTAGKFKEIKGLEHLDKVIHIDQSPIGKTPRSNPGTYTQVFNPIRELFSNTRESKARGYKPGRFSFNVKGGRCEACKGDGIIKIEMHFLPDVYVDCDICKGQRYNRETLDIKYKNKNIAQVLDMTVNQSIRFFENISAIRTKLATLIEVGLGYIKLGQAATTLSGGEAQRMKLAKELSKKGTGKTIYLLDEPTTGLHSDDINKLLFVLNKLVDSNNTVIVIEHNLDVIKCADHVIDLGPEGGDKGGEIVALGTPEDIAQNKKSYTGYYLKKTLSK